MHNPYYSEEYYSKEPIPGQKKGHKLVLNNPDTQGFYVQLNQVSDSLWSMLLEESPEKHENVAKTRHWEGSFDGQGTQHYIASRILVNDKGEKLPTLGACTGAGFAMIGRSKPLNKYSNPQIDENTYDITNGSIERDGKTIPIEGIGTAAAIGLWTTSADMHTNNFCVDDNDDRIRVKKFDNKYTLGAGASVEGNTKRSFLKASTTSSQEAADAELQEAKAKLELYSKHPRGGYKEPEKEAAYQKLVTEEFEDSLDAKRSLNTKISLLEKQTAPLLKPMESNEDLDATLRDVFTDQKFIKGDHLAHTFKFPFDTEDIIHAPHVREEFMATIHVISQLKPERIQELCSEIIGDEQISPITGRPVSELIATQLQSNAREMHAAIERCPEYQTFVEANHDKLNGKIAVAEAIIDRSISEFGLNNERGRGKRTILNPEQAKQYTPQKQTIAEERIPAKEQQGEHVLSRHGSQEAIDASQIKSSTKHEEVDHTLSQHESQASVKITEEEKGKVSSLKDRWQKLIQGQQSGQDKGNDRGI